MKTRYFLPLCALAVVCACNSDDPDMNNKPSTGNTGDDPENKTENPQDSVSNDSSSNNEEWVTAAEIDLSSLDRTNLKALGNFNDKLLSGVAASSDDGSFCVSPLSASIYLGMLANSCQGEAQAQILDALQCSNLSDFNALSTKLLDYLPQEGTGSRMMIANRVWVANRYTVPSTYITTMADVFNAGVESVDFSKDATFIGINKWASDNTNGLISTIIPEYLWNGLRGMNMYSANAIYFMGKWDSEFDPSETDKATFYAAGGAVTVPMMHKEAKMYYAKDNVAEMLSLDFSGGVNTLEIYLPAVGTDVAEIANKINESKRYSLGSSQKLSNVTLSLPSFAADELIGLNDVLASMGLKSIGHVDLAPMGISGLTPLNVNQRVVIKVDEKGAELAAVTGGLAGAPSQEEPENVTMNVDRPFMYVVRNNITNTILVAGVVAKP